MAAPSPLDTITALIEARSKKDMDGAYACYEPAATVVFEPGKFGSGESAIKSFIEAASSLALSFESHEIVEAGDLALHLSKYTLDMGNGHIAAGRTADVLRRGPDGLWRIVLDDAWANQ